MAEPPATSSSRLIEPLKRVYRRLYWLPRDLLALQKAGWPDWIIYFGGAGFGDDLLLTSVLHELRKRDSGRLAVISRLTEIFDASPDVDLVINNQWGVLDAQLRFGRRGVKPFYYRGFTEPDIDIPSDGHIIAEMCRQIGLKGPVDLATYIHLRPDELAAGLRLDPKRQAVIQCMASTSLNSSANKVWITERYQEVVDQNRDRLDFIQIGSPGDPPLRGVLDLRGKTTIRESAAILARSRVMVGYVGFLMHLARAAGCRAAIIFGGREHPRQSGYACNENLFTPLPCSPCWRRKTCVDDHACMRAITADHVTDAITRILARAGAPLETSVENID